MGVRVREWKGAWWVFKTYNKQRQAVRIGTGRDGKKKADEVARRVAAMAALGDPAVFDRPVRVVAPTSAPTFADVAQEWLAKYPALHAIRPSTLENYRSFTEKHLVPFFGTMPVDTITVDTIESFIEAKRAPGGSVRFEGKSLSDASLRTGLHALRLILKRAVRRKLIAANPASDAEWSGANSNADNVDPFTLSELVKILAAADRLAAQAEAGPWRAFFPAMLRVWMRTGMRAGEVAGLQWQDVDLAAGTVFVRRTYSRRRLGPTKTGRTRTVSMLHPIAEATAEWRPGSMDACRDAVAALRRLTVRALEPEAFVFTDRGRPLASNNLNQIWRRVLSAARVRYRMPEQLRHTFASTLLSRNAPLLYVQQQGGWRSAAVLLKVYARWLPTDAQGGSVQPAATSRDRAAVI